MSFGETNLFRGAVLAAIAALLPIAASAAAARVDVMLEDGSTDSRVTGMVLAAVPATVRAGKVVFHAVNASQVMVHEMILVRLDGGADLKALPIDPAQHKVNEAAIPDLGEVSDLEPNKAGDLTVTLKPGRYALMCNQPGHYMAGMSTELVVTK